MATPSWNTPIACTTCCLTSGTQTISKLDKKWSATAIKASFGQRLNQSIVHPLIRPGNLSDLLRNFSPTWTRKKRRKRWAWELTLMRLILVEDTNVFVFYSIFWHKKHNIFRILWPSFVVSIFVNDIPARNTEQHEDCAWLASGSSRTDFPLSVVAWEIPSSSQVSARCRFRQSHREQKDWIFRRRIEDCWGTQGSPLLWFLGRWRWMLFPSPAFLPLGKDTWGLPSSWKRCKTCEI